MRKLLFWISTSLILFLFGCEVGKKSKENEKQPTNSVKQVDSVSTNNLTWKEKRRLRKLENNKEAPVHNSPYQHEIDSIKNAKAKLKGQ